MDLISILEVETKIDLLFQLEVSLISDSRYRSADYDLRLMLNNRFNRYSILLYAGYKYSNIDVKYHNTPLDSEVYEGASYTGFSLGAGMGYSRDIF